jgi:hypothetical protein
MHAKRRQEQQLVDILVELAAVPVDILVEAEVPVDILAELPAVPADILVEVAVPVDILVEVVPVDILAEVAVVPADILVEAVVLPGVFQMLDSEVRIFISAFIS